MTSVARELLATLEERGVTYRVEGDLLQMSGPKGALDAFDLARIKAHKPEILAYLRQARITRPARWTSTATADESEVLSDWTEIAARPRPDPATLDAGAVAAWIERSALPPAPFEVRPGETVIDVAAYAKALLRELRRDPALREPAPAATLDQGRAFLRQIFGGTA